MELILDFLMSFLYGLIAGFIVFVFLFFKNYKRNKDLRKYKEEGNVDEK